MGISKLIVVLLLFVPTAYATEPVAISPSPYEVGGKITVVLNEDGTWTTSVVLIDGKVYQEDCIVKMSPFTKEQPIPEFIGKACTRIRIAIPDES
ncbi:hypothetical protein GQL56_01375 [Pseudomonas putida]|nr:hypothetical protein [Pseudomonas putida]